MTTQHWRRTGGNTWRVEIGPEREAFRLGTFDSGVWFDDDLARRMILAQQADQAPPLYSANMMHALASQATRFLP